MNHFRFLPPSHYLSFLELKKIDKLRRDGMEGMMELAERWNTRRDRMSGGKIWSLRDGMDEVVEWTEACGGR